MGQKRTRTEAMEENNETNSPFMSMFETFRKELDEHHDRRERTIKRSRDITAASKKIIFGLQRSRTVSQPLHASIIKTIQPHADIITQNYDAAFPDLQGINAWRYARNISGGNQEYIEAATFQHYLTSGRLLTYEELCTQFQDMKPSLPQQDIDLLEEKPSLESIKPVVPSIEDYILGLYDMTGELMRFGITAIATSGELPRVNNLHPKLDDMTDDGNQVTDRTVLTDLRAIRAGLESLDVGHGSSFARDVEKKFDVMKVSVEKVEKALYGLIVRGAERPKGWVPDLESSGHGRDVDVEA